MAKFEYTDEVVAEVTKAYNERRTAGEMNAYILEDLASEYDGMTVRSLRAKLMVENAYIKDTEEEKAKLAERREAEKANKPKTARRTKKMVATAILSDLGLNVRLADDLSKAKADTLDAVFEAVRAITEPASDEEPDPAEEVVSDEEPEFPAVG